MKSPVTKAFLKGQIRKSNGPKQTFISNKTGLFVWKSEPKEVSIWFFYFLDNIANMPHLFDMCHIATKKALNSVFS